MSLVSIFKTPVNVAIDAVAARLTKTAGGDSWNAGAISRAFLPALANNHGCRWKAIETDKYRMCGLSSNTDTDQSQTDIEFAFYARQDATLVISESGVVSEPAAPVNYAANELLEIILEDLGDTRVFSDDFNDGEIDGEKWNIETPASATVITESNGKLLLTLPTAATGYNSLAGDAVDLTGKSVSLDVDEFPYQSGYNDCGLYLWIDANNHCIFFVSGGTGYFRILNGGVQTQVNFGFDTAQVKKMRIRHNSTDGKFYFDTYTNSQGWRAHGSQTPSFSVSALIPKIYAGEWNAYNPSGRFVVDNVKIEDFNGSGFVVRYYRTPEGGARQLFMTSTKDDSFIRSILPLRVDCSIYQETGVIDSIEIIGANWQDESARSRFVTSRPQTSFGIFASDLIKGSGSGGGNPSPTTGQIFPRGLN